IQVGGFARCSTVFYPVFVTDLTSSRARGFGMRDAGSIAPELPASPRAIREYSRFCGGVKRAFSPSVCPIVQIPPSVDIFRSKVVATVGFYRHAPIVSFWGGGA